MAFRFGFFPRDEQFFELFNQMADEIRSAAGLLEQLLAAEPPDVGKVDAIKDAEHRCDALTHDTIQRLHRTFVTPFDREDLYALATSLDNVMDAIDHAAALVRLYRIDEGPAGRARTGAHGRPASAERLHDGARRARGQEAGASARGRDQPAGERGGPRLSGRGAARCSKPRPTRSRSSSGRSSSTCSRWSPTPARTSPTSSKASSSSTGSLP